MISNVNDDSFSDKKFFQFNLDDLNFIKNKQLNKCSKILFLFLLILIIIIISVILFKFYKILSLNNQILSLKNERLKIKKETKDIEKDYLNIIEEKKKLNTELYNIKKELKEKIDKSKFFSEIFYPYKSDIIETFNELNYIRNLFNGNKIEMVYKSSINGDNSTYFYDITRNYSSYLILILSKSGRKFGAYTSLNFEGKKIGVSDFEYYKIDNKAFLFSLTDKKTFHVKKDKFALICTDDNLINFGENDLVISNNFLSQISYSDFPINFEGNEKDFKNFIGNDTFQVKEFELFHISKLED